MIHEGPVRAKFFEFERPGKPKMASIFGKMARKWPIFPGPPQIPSLFPVFWKWPGRKFPFPGLAQIPSFAQTGNQKWPIWPVLPGVFRRLRPDLKNLAVRSKKGQNFPSRPAGEEPKKARKGQKSAKIPEYGQKRPEIPKYGQKARNKILRPDRLKKGQNAEIWPQNRLPGSSALGLSPLKSSKMSDNFSVQTCLQTTVVVFSNSPFEFLPRRKMA